MADFSSENFGVPDNQAGAAPVGPGGDLAAGTGGGPAHSGDASRAPEPPQRSSSAHRARAAPHTPTMHWFACIGPSNDAMQNNQNEINEDDSTISQLFLGEERVSTSRAGSRRSSVSRDHPDHVISDLAAKDAAAAAAAQKEREERIRILKEKQSEERQRKLEELKQQALAAQRFREQKEEERRRRIEELRQRDQDRRSQVEERKRLLWEAEREKREQLIRKTQEREARLEAKRRNERSSIVFAFGSSTPRMLEPSDTGGSFWGTRRATSTSNVMFSGAPLTRRCSERELEGSMSRKQRATSAHALDRKPGDDIHMSSSMYEVFHWDLDEPPTSAKPPKPPAPLSLPTQSPPAPVPVPRGRKSPCPRLPSKALSLPPQSPPPLSPLHPTGAASVRGDEDQEDGIPGQPSSRARKKTDLMPTIPSRDGSRSRHRSPGTKSQSLSHLNLLSSSSTPKPPPRKPQTLVQPNLASRAALSRSTGTLHKQQLQLKQDSAAMQQQQLRKTRATQSMSQLAPKAPVAPPRMTRAERLRQKARQISIANKEKAAAAAEIGTHRVGTDTTPSSRPQSAMSGQSEPRPSQPVQLRPRPPARKPRPSSIAVTGVGVTNDALKLARTPVSDSKQDNKDGNKTAPVPRTRKSSAPNTAAKANNTDSNKRAPSRSKDKLTPRATPLVSPASEQPPEPITSKENLVSTEDEEHEKQDEMKPETPPEAAMVISSQQPESDQPPLPPQQQQQQGSLVASEELPECDMTASMLAKQRYTTEEEAKAALAERRRLAREQAEREAELERQRQEEAERLEAEKIKREEEEQRRQEEETLRLLEEAKKAEEQRLREAIEEAKRREAEEAALREEEARQRMEKEEMDKKAREEAEKVRKEMAEKLKKEEEERQARRKRVEAIMSRTRKGGTPSGPQKDGEEDGGGKVSPSEELEQQSNESNECQPAPTNGPTNGSSNHTNGHHPALLVDVTNDLLDLGLNKTAVQLDKANTPDILLDFEAPSTPKQQENGAVTDLLS